MKLHEVSKLAELSYKYLGETEYLFCKRLGSEPTLVGLRVVCFAEDGLEGYAAVCDSTKHAYVVFRGTEEVSDLRVDLRTWPVQNLHGVGSVHRGTQSFLAGAWDTVWHMLVDMDVASVSFVGHSLGGMLAVLASDWIGKFLPNTVVTSVITFGSPPVGSHTFATTLDQRLEGKIIHVVNCCDVIPRFWTTRVVGLRSTGSTLYLDSAGGYVIDPSWLVMLGDRLRAVWAARSLALSFSHHKRSEYTRKLEHCGL